MGFCGSFHLAKSFGLPYLSAYLNALGANFSHGANFATAASSIMPQTIPLMQPGGVSPISLDVQYNEFYDFRRRSQTVRNRCEFVFLQMGLSKFWQILISMTVFYV